MKIPAFELEQYLGNHEFRAPHVLCSSDCETLSIEELLSFEPTAKEAFLKLRLGYMMSEGNPELLSAIASQYSQTRPSQVVSFAGAEEGIFVLMNSLLEKGDHIIGHFPAYQSLLEIPRTIGCEVSLWKADEKNGWALDIEFLKKAIQKNTKLIILNVPHNPTGYLMPQAEFREVMHLADKHGVYVLSDEVYRGLEYSGASLPAAADIYPRGISLGVMSKGFGLPGLRVGWIASQDQSILSGCVAYKHYTSICNAAPSEFLAAVALRNAQRVFSRNKAIISANLELLRPFFEKHSAHFEWNRPQAGCIAFPKYKKGSASKFCEQILNRSGVLLAPGTAFQFDDSHFRIGFGKKELGVGLERLDDSLGASG